MAKLNRDNLLQKYNNPDDGVFADNRFGLTEEVDFRTLVLDFVDSFAPMDGSTLPGGHLLLPLVLPLTTVKGAWYVADSGIWEALTSENIAVEPVAGAQWVLVVAFAAKNNTVTVGNITNASAAGRKMLTATSAAKQLALLDVLDIKENQYGTHPAFNRAYPGGDMQGLLLFLLQAYATMKTVQTPARPLAPTNGQVNDKGDLFSFIGTAGYLLNTNYRVVGLPGSEGVVAFDATNSYVENGRIYLKVVGPVLKGDLAVYVGGSGSVPDGLPLFNLDEFTGPVASPEGILNFIVQGDDAIINFSVTAI